MLLYSFHFVQISICGSFSNFCCHRFAEQQQKKKENDFDEYEMTINEVSWKALTCKSMQMKSQHHNIKISSHLFRLFRVYSHFVFSIIIIACFAFQKGTKSLEDGMR